MPKQQSWFITETMEFGTGNVLIYYLTLPALYFMYSKGYGSGSSWIHFLLNGLNRIRFHVLKLFFEFERRLI